MKLTTLLVLSLAACGGGSNSATDANNYPDAPTDPSQRYEPWKVGSVWSYKLTDPKNQIPPAMNKLTTIGAMEDPGNGKMAYKVHIEKLVGSKDVWEVPFGDFDVRYKTVFFDQNNAQTEVDTDTPYRLKLDESIAHTMTGAHFTETFSESVVLTGGAPSTKTKMYTWTVVSDHEAVTVIAGSYTCLHVQRDDGTGPQDYWYARGVGKIKETGGGQDEELMSYTP